MKDKLNERIGYYNKMLVRKESLVKIIHNKNSKFEEVSSNEHTTMLILENEIRMIKEILEDLKYIGEN